MLSPQGLSNSYGGELLIQAANADPSSGSDKNAALYKLTVCKTAGGSFIEQLSAIGRVSGAGGSWPSFTWTINNDQLQATPINSTSGNFYFEVLGTGFVKTTL